MFERACSVAPSDQSVSKLDVVGLSHRCVLSVNHSGLRLSVVMLALKFWYGSTRASSPPRSSVGSQRPRAQPRLRDLAQPRDGAGGGDDRGDGVEAETHDALLRRKRHISQHAVCRQHCISWRAAPLRGPLLTCQFARATMTFTDRACA